MDENFLNNVTNELTFDKLICFIRNICLELSFSDKAHAFDEITTKFMIKELETFAFGQSAVQLCAMYTFISITFETLIVIRDH